jgi:hypothetical protein
VIEGRKREEIMASRTRKGKPCLSSDLFFPYLRNAERSDAH